MQTQSGGDRLILDYRGAKPSSAETLPGISCVRASEIARRLLAGTVIQQAEALAFCLHYTGQGIVHDDDCCTNWPEQLLELAQNQV